MEEELDIHGKDKYLFRQSAELENHKFLKTLFPTSQPVFWEILYNISGDSKIYSIGC